MEEAAAVSQVPRPEPQLDQVVSVHGREINPGQLDESAVQDFSPVSGRVSQRIEQQHDVLLTGDVGAFGLALNLSPLPGGDAVGGAESAAEVRRVGEAPPAGEGRDRYGLVPSQVASSAFEPSPHDPF